jgi:hypothetical protein
MKKEFVTRYNYIIFKVLFLTTHVRDTSFHSKSLERFAKSKDIYAVVGVLHQQPSNCPCLLPHQSTFFLFSCCYCSSATTQLKYIFIALQTQISFYIFLPFANAW